MTQEESILIIEKVISNNLEHKYYQRTKDIKSFCAMVSTGEGQNEIVSELRPSEEEGLKAQRVRLYNTATKIALNPVKREFQKLSNIDGQKAVLELNDKGKADKIINFLESFYANKTAQEHTFARLLFYTFFDPNACFIVRPNFESQTGRASTLKGVYPLEIESDAKFMWEKFAGDYKYLMTRSKRTEFIEIRKGGAQKPIECTDYIFYSTGLEIELFDITEKLPEFLIDVQFEEREISIKNEGQKDSVKKYAVLYYPNAYTTFPVIDFGFMLDDLTNGETFISPINECEELFLDLIRDKSLADNTVMLHAFPQELRVGQICNHEEEHGGLLHRCEGGYVNHRKCGNCGGSGMVKHKTEQQTNYVTAEVLKDYSLSLSDLAYYHLLPEWFLPRLEERIQSHKEGIYRAVFNAEIPKTQFQGQKTATEIESQSLEQYKARKNFANKHAELMTYVLETSAQFFQAFSEGSKAFYTYPTELNTKNITQLYAELQTALVSKAPFEILDSIYMKIIEVQNLDNPFEIQRLKLRLKFKPFLSLTKEELSIVLAERDKLDLDRLLFENHSQIFYNIESSENYMSFMTANYETQKKTVYSEVEKFGAAIKFAENTVDNTQFNSLFNQTDTQE